MGTEYIMNYSDKRVAFTTLGCKLNFSETSTIARSFKELGFARVDFKELADVYVINTCSVTDAADKKSRHLIKQAEKQNPAAFIVVIGCYAQLKPDEIIQIPGVDLVLGANDKFNITKYLENLQKHEKGVTSTCQFKEIESFNHAYSFGDRTRTFLKVQDGCNYFCSYCTIPLARGKSRNPSIESLVGEAREIASKGTKEIILTGVNIGDFGKSTGEKFIDLIKALDGVDGIERIRISSIEPNLLTDEVIEFAAVSNKIAPHFHIPLQAGNNVVLELMKRKYKREVFESRVLKIKSLMPHAFIGVDVIAGMSGETEEYFADALQFITNLPISQLHVFPYSERSNTKAIDIDGKVPVSVRKERAKHLQMISERFLKMFYQENVGLESNVIFEEQRDKTTMVGWSDNYVKVEMPYDAKLVNCSSHVLMTGVNEKGHMTCQLLN
ncbi:tRNA (N(6)-L-threonylcarbamoyladenosine(37)-C(2))-methylthiotransferase MtaB [Halosquirtibacter laminarini]|uniref:tRNA (N(6)-L-threonylcarbamoyladenosine(37)-C(2))-methylthiotransferase MtaB n=1 Tax=Halosquirtibacter laminarini TaxID=3374600 RepID=A0AC61NFP5_9BACT|nr:tRNA (N(6)-L-threonylcarbamoyladenosine(37)-C(2))-methylthiotransferase MtaB [Prolixibacteraceae bacterium]